MKLSVIVIFHNMRREARRTLFTLSGAYQRGADASSWEVIAIDNGSSEPLDEGMVGEFGSNFRYVFHETSSVSPCTAINKGVRMARGRYVAVSVDGARMVSPGMIGYTLKALSLYRHPVSCSLSWHLGSKPQNMAFEEGYDQVAEDRLLDGIDWVDNGYELFSISTVAPSSGKGFFDRISESGFLALPISDFWAIGGFEERFQAPGGGRANIDFYKRAVEYPGMKVVHLLGEGTFHQFHGGVTTNVPRNQHPRQRNLEEYHRIRGEPYSRPDPAVTYIGHLPDQARRFLHG